MDAHRDRTALWRRGAVGLAVATVTNLIVFAIGRAAGAAFIIPAEFSRTGQPMPLVPAGVAMFTIVPSVLALAVATVAVRWSWGPRAMQIAAVVVTLVTLAAPLSLDADTASRLLLALMHFPPGVAFVLTLQRRSAATGVPGGDPTRAGAGA